MLKTFENDTWRKLRVPIKRYLLSAGLFSSTGLVFGFLALGLSLTFSIPPFQIPDEDTHLIVGLDRLLKDRAPAIKSYWQGLPDLFHVKQIKHFPDQKFSTGQFEKNPTFDVNNPRKAMLHYGFVLTYPHLIAAFLYSALESGSPAAAIRGFYLARLLGGLLVFFPLFRLLGLSNRSRTPGVLTVLAFCLSPLFIQQSFAISSDVVCNAFALWALLVILKKDEARPLDWGMTAVTGVIASMTKPPLFTIACTVFLICGPAFKNNVSDSKGRSATSRSAEWKLPLAILAIALIVARETFIFIQSVRNRIPHEFLAHPMTSVGLIWNGLFSKVLGFREFVGPLGWLDTEISPSTYHHWLIILASAFVIDMAMGWLGHSDSHRSRKEKLMRGGLLLGGALSYGLAISACMYYFRFQRQTFPQQMLQGRYLFPGMVLAIVGFHDILFAWKKEPEEANIAAPTTATKRENLFLTGLGIVAGGELALYFIWIHWDIARRFW